MISGESVIWESGFNRIADLSILREQQKGYQILQQHDEWEYFQVKFEVKAAKN